jgi:ATP-dependent protease ClpP protease subunit
MKINNIVAQEGNKSITVAMFGGIGEAFNGDYFAQELMYLCNNYEEVNVIINSGGGNILEGESMIAAIQTGKAKTTCIINKAFSMAAVFSQAFDTRLILPNGGIMIHNGYFPNKKELSDNDKKAINHFNNSMAIVLSSKSIAKEKIKELMEKETWLNATESLEYKLVDKIIDFKESDNKLKHAAEYVAKYENEQNEQNSKPKEKKDMYKLVATYLGIKGEADETQIIAGIQELKEKEAEILKLANELKAKNEALQIELDKAKSEQLKAQNAEIETLVNKAISEGIFEASEKEALIESAKDNFAGFKTLISKMKAPVASLTEDLKNLQNGGGKIEGEKDYEYYINNLHAAMQFKAQHPQRFAFLEKEYENKLNAK